MAASERPATIGITIDRPPSETGIQLTAQTPAAASNQSNDPPLPTTKDTSEPSQTHSNPHDTLTNPDDEAKSHLTVFEKDVERGQISQPPSSAPDSMRKTSRNTLASSLPQSRNPSFDTPQKRLREENSSVWPSRKELQEKARFNKKQDHRKNWNLLGTLDRRSRMWAKLGIAFLVVALAVGLGVGITIAVGGKVYKPNGKEVPIPVGGR